MMFEIDLEKAYDKVDWGFLIQTLKMFNFTTNFIQLIQTCISTTTLAVMEWREVRIFQTIPWAMPM